MPPGSWTLVGGLMVQLHALHAGLEPLRPTVDVDLVLHLETDRASWRSARQVLESLGYELRRSITESAPVHRFQRAEDRVDVMMADHVAPRAITQRAGGERLIRVPGGTSALRKTVECTVQYEASVVTISVPDALGALSLKGGAYLADSRDRNRHLEDAVVLSATVDDADAITQDPSRWTAHDPQRVRALAASLPDAHEAWGLLPRSLRPRAQASLRILAGGPTSPR